MGREGETRRASGSSLSLKSGALCGSRLRCMCRGSGWPSGASPFAWAASSAFSPDSDTCPNPLAHSREPESAQRWR